MQEYQQRVIIERRDLDEKFDKLRSFVYEGKVFLTLPRQEQIRLSAQLGAMAMYSNLLAERINAFE